MILHTRWNISEKPAPVKEEVKKEVPKKKKANTPKASKPAATIKSVEEPKVEEFIANLLNETDEVKTIIEE